MADGSFSVQSDPRGGSTELRRLSALYRRHAGFVARVLRRCGISESDLDDATQEVFLVVHRRLADFEARAAETTWLYAVCVRVASTLRRSQQREQARRHRAGADMHGRPAADPEVALSLAEGDDILRALLEELDEPKRIVFVLAELEGLKAPQIAEIVGANPRTVNSRLRLARASFASAVQRYQAREHGRLARSRLSIARLRRADERRRDRPHPAAWLALVGRIEAGAVPLLAHWTPPLTATFAAASATPLIAMVSAVLTTSVLLLGSAAAAGPPSPDGLSTPVPTVTAHVPVRPDPGAARLAPAPVPPPPRSPGLDPSSRPGAEASGRRRPLPVTADGPDRRLDEETRLLEEARRQLERGRPVAALEVLRRYETDHLDALLRPERDATRIRALCAAGRRAEADRASRGHPALRRMFAATCG